MLHERNKTGRSAGGQAASADKWRGGSVIGRAVTMTACAPKIGSMDRKQRLGSHPTSRAFRGRESDRTRQHDAIQSGVILAAMAIGVVEGHAQ
ncbi:hypothetical protein A7Q26_08810 [Sphingobium sp. TCM1]|nr:hypothetical protein A7Q26_08810 [Sphingobium sp. TCM1]